MKQRMTRRVLMFSGLLAVAAVTALAFQAGAQRTQRVQPTAVATVNLTRALEGLEERAAAERDLEAMTNTFKQQDEQRMAEIEQMEAALEDIVDEQARRKKRDDIDLRTLEYLSWRRVKAEQLDVERALLLQDLYKKMADAIAEQAAANGYDLVLVDDSSSNFSYNPEARLTREMQVRQQIASRRMMWRADAIDMTDDLIVRMNNAFQAGGGVAVGSSNGDTP